MLEVIYKSGRSSEYVRARAYYWKHPCKQAVPTQVSGWFRLRRHLIFKQSSCESYDRYKIAHINRADD
jgi:hypothetical protein